MKVPLDIEAVSTNHCRVIIRFYVFRVYVPELLDTLV